MSSVVYKLKCLKNMDFSNMLKIVDKIHKRTRFSKIKLIIDMLICSNKYGAGYYDYQEFEFYNLNKDERKTYLTRVKNNAIVREYNDKEYFKYFDDKKEFNKIFNKFLKRDWLYLDNNYDEFVKFCSDKKEIIVKPIDGCGGFGVELIKVSKSNLKKIYNNLITTNRLLVEEKIKQHKSLSKLNKSSVNSLRIVSFYDGKKVHILNSVFKIGNGGVTDNFSSGSMYTFVKDGKIIVPAIDRDDNIFYKHPISNTYLIGYEVPNYDKVIKLVNECAKKIKEVQYVGWDVAIMDDDVCLIEGNCYPGIYQIKPSFLSKKEGLVKIYEDAMKIKIDKL